MYIITFKIQRCFRNIQYKLTLLRLLERNTHYGTTQELCHTRYQIIHSSTEMVSVYMRSFENKRNNRCHIRSRCVCVSTTMCVRKLFQCYSKLSLTVHIPRTITCSYLLSENIRYNTFHHHLNNLNNKSYVLFLELPCNHTVCQIHPV